VPWLLTLIFSAAPSWPSPAAPLRVVPSPPLAAPLRVVVDAGHGAPGNLGNHGCHCQREADETLVEARALAQRLRRFGFTVLETRTVEVGARYAARIAALERFKPHLVVSLHTDARADAWPSETSADGGVCFANRADPGFAVLWSAEGPRAVVRAREAWGRAVSRSLRVAGFLAYSGADYGSLYRADGAEPGADSNGAEPGPDSNGAEPGCFIDARPLEQRVYFLRATQVAPVIIVETHHALDPLEVARWGEAATHDAFAAAIGSAALEVAQGR